MSRSGYTDGCEHIQLYRNAVNRALQGRRGQAFLRELVEALDALPEPKLIAHWMVSAGEVCALGAVGLARRMDPDELDSLNTDDPDYVARSFGIAWSMAAEIMYENDEATSRAETDEQRFARMRAWAVGQLRETA